MDASCSTNSNKTCIDCGECKDLSAFHSRGKGFSTRAECGPCRAIRRRKRKRVHVEEKRCSTCDNVRPACEFHKDITAPTGLCSRCNTCKKIERESVTVDQWISRKSTCTVCGAGLSKNRYEIGLCAKCDETSRQRTEMRVWEQIKDHLPPPSSRDNVMTGGSCGEHKRRADVSWVGKDRVIFLEIDEYSHSARSIDCELGKLDSTKWGLSEDYQCKFTAFVRMNPDIHKGSPVPFERRCEDTVRAVKKWLTCEPKHPHLIHVEYLHYGDSGRKHIQAAKQKESIIVY